MNEFEQALSGAREDFEKKNHKRAAILYEKALTGAPDSRQRAIIYAEMSWAYYESGEYEQALAAAKKVTVEDPHYKAQAELYRVMAFCYIALNDENKAEECLTTSIEMDNSSQQQQITLYELVKLYFKKQNYNQALKIINDIETYFYQNQKEYWLSLLFFKGFIFYYSNDLQQSEKVFEELLENAQQEQRKAEAFFGLAFVNYTRKEYLKTINLCEAVLKSDPRFSDTETLGFLTAGSFFHLGRKDVFEKYFEQLQKKFPGGRYIEELKQMKAKIQN